MGNENKCPCCGSELESGIYGYAIICPVCGWADDPSVSENESSIKNDGLSHDEAQMNFRVFGAIHLPCDKDD